ncbi:MAG TPA: tetratricopeptide repeat protein [Chthoniobacterales bacterium]|jgi:tetratricopeptide (TPR) repeat protein|nr:tetratricopeptide repeat protein [Chthoniobacterales bacterium]
MAVKTEKELNETQRSLWLKAMAAVELRNFGYAISLLQGILKQEPQFLTGRQLLRRAEVARQKSGKKSFFNISTAPIAVMKAQREIKKTPQRAVEMIEKVLEEEPYNRQANLTLKEAAVAAGWPEIGVFALRTLLEGNPRDVKLLRELGQLYRQAGQNEEEVEIYNRITEIDPLDAAALRLGKDASARASMSSGGWTQAESYRELIKDKDVAISMEQQSQMQLTGEALEQQIAELEAQQHVKPQNVDLVRRLGALCEQKDDIESAGKWYQRAVDLTGGRDAGLVRKVSDLKMRGAERDIAEHEEFLAGHTKKDAIHAKRSQELQVAKKKRAGILIEETKKQLERNPTDLQLRFELGEHFVSARRFREAVPELQRARQNPNARLKAMNLLGVCYRELGMLDLAMKQLEDAAKEVMTMDAMKKEIVYNLGTVYEKMGEREKSLNCMKQIYEADYDYKDVAERVESSYRQDKGRC